jgi:serine/threonine-protein kinase RsbW
MALPETQHARQGSLDVTLPADPASVAHARSLICGLIAGLGATSRAGDIMLALSEACGNVVLHAYRPEDPGRTLRLAARASAETLVVEVTDRGQGLESRHSLPGLGLGLELIQRLADDVLIQSQPGCGTSISMTFRPAA